MTRLCKSSFLRCCLNKSWFDKVGKDDVKERLTGSHAVEQSQSHLLEQPYLAFLTFLGEEEHVGERPLVEGIVVKLYIGSCRAISSK